MTNGMESTNWERVVFSRLIPWDPFLQSSPLFSLELVCRTTVCTSVSGKLEKRSVARVVLEA